MRANHFRLAAICALISCGLNACLKGDASEVAGGGGVETTDGEVLAMAGLSQGVRMRLVPQFYNPLASQAFPDSLSAITDASGGYAFKNVPAGRYNLEAYQPKDGTRMRLPDLAVQGSGSHTLPSAALARTGRLRLNWEGGGHHGYLFVPGTTILHRILPDEVEVPVIVLDSLPKGPLPPVLWSESAADKAGKPVTDSVVIQSDSTTEWTVFAAWDHHADWIINTSATGAGVAGDVAAFPMLVRLSAKDFDFSQAALDGRDIRFSDPDGSELAYEVERWDAADGVAEIWVEVPLVSGNGAKDFFRMHWGNADADARSSGAAVFGAANGFTAVFHLGETGNTDPGGYADATGSGRNGTGISTAADSWVDGMVGRGQNLNGTTQRIKVAGTFPTGASARCLSAWAKSVNPSAGSQLATYGSDANYAAFGLWNDRGTWTAWHWGAGNDIPTSAKADTAWHLITLDYDGATSRFYVDGTLAGSAARTLATTATGFSIGSNYKGDVFWPGMVDEVRMSNSSRSADWIKLAFETQRRNAGTLQLKILK